jgi:hypothetical protein
MNRQTLRLALLAVALILACGPATGAPAPEQKKITPEDIAKGEAAVKAQLEKMKGAGAGVTYVKDDAVEKALPGQMFFAVLFRQYPVGRVPPEGLSASNVFAVDLQGQVTVCPNAAALNKYLKTALPPVKNDDQAKDAGRAYARLSQEFHQDGFFKFQVMDDATKVGMEKGGRTATVKYVVMQGGNGDVEVVVKFDPEGKFLEAVETAKIKAGPRPICQATLLLHEDPLVRRICEQDLLVMGEAALPYLAEQRAKASPALQKEIDRVSRRIQAGER